MCGIAGIVRLDGAPVSADSVAVLTDLIAHRGPDDAGVHVDGHVGLGHRRLSIVDLSPAGHQPMPSSDGSLWIVFNGEIYNHEALRLELQALGHGFRSTTDTEVILAAYRQWGEACVQRFEGMWAFAIWEPARQRLFCSRDRLGIKPFYYALTPAGFAFASEIKAVLASGLVPVRPNHEALRLQLLYRVRASNETTCFEGVLQLPPAHNAVLEGGRWRRARYWNAEDALASRGAGGDHAARFREEISRAVHSHLRSDVPVGACLSGGLDSGTLVALAARETASPLRTFSVTYPGTVHDESRYIHALRGKIGNLHGTDTSPDGRDLIDVLERSTWHYEEPVWGGSVYSWWQVMKSVNAGGIKVVLNGQGADELLAGYPRYYPTYLRQLLLSGRAGALRHNFEGFRAQQGDLSRLGLWRELATPFWPDWLRRAARVAGRGSAFDDSFLSPELRALSSPAAEALARRAFSDLDTHLLSDLTVTRLPELLQAEDRFSMAFSIESRVPFLDRAFVEYGIALPAAQKIDNGVTKVVLREAMRGIVPDETLDRRDKQGYPTPANDWLRSVGVDYAGDLISSRAFRERGVFDAAASSRAFERWRRGQGALPGLWTWLSAENWYRQYVDTPASDWGRHAPAVGPAARAASAPDRTVAAITSAAE
ncbi:asparagine synthase (glutamine-hydrolyzing) [Luteimonas sp. SDU101]|uniref:asparagine synthase (glutamine-hydrolyzing) n=1 Tax=Luteimonas sp. SDU101 TaxID=3422593 RepID=UPI003EBF5413